MRYFTKDYVIKKRCLSSLDGFLPIPDQETYSEEDISNYVLKLEINEYKILRNIAFLTNREIKNLGFLIILNEEKQKEFKLEFDKLNSEINEMKKKVEKLTENENNEYNEKRKKLSYIRSNYGVIYFQKVEMTYYLFSITDFCFYDKENKKVEHLDIYYINFIKDGFYNFCINEYNLVPIDSDEKILTDKEKTLLLEKLQTKIKGIEDIAINYEISGEIQLLVGTPWNFAILCITDEIKVMTHFNEKFTIFLIVNDEVSIYEQSRKLFDYGYRSSLIKKRYFVKLLINKEEYEQCKDLRYSFYHNKLKFLQKKR